VRGKDETGVRNKPPLTAGVAEAKKSVIERATLFFPFRLSRPFRVQRAFCCVRVLDFLRLFIKDWLVSKSELILVT